MKQVGVPPEGLGLGPVPENEVVVEVAPTREPATPREWVRQNLFPTPISGVLTVATTLVVAYLAYRFVRWVFVTADWQVIKTNLRVYMVGRFPIAELWRVWASGFVVIVLAGLSWGVSGMRLRWTPRTTALRLALVGLFAGALVYLLEGTRIWLLIGLAVAVYAGAVAAGRGAGRRLRLPLVVGWSLAFPAVILLLIGVVLTFVQLRVIGRRGAIEMI